MNSTRFRRLVNAVLLSAGPITIAGCSGRTDMPERAQCIDLKTPSRYAQLTLAPGVDGVALAARLGPEIGRLDGAAERPSERLPSLGVPCAGATDKAACERRVTELLEAPTSVGWSIGSCGQACTTSSTDVGVVTSGDDVRLATFDDLTRAVAPIGSREEAATLLTLRGGSFDCGDENVRPEDDGWTFKSTHSSCSGAESETFTKVTHAGAVVAAGTNKISSANNGCIEGRRPAGLQSTSVNWLSSVAACFAEIAHMEAASVVAFDELARQLGVLEAPEELMARVREARADEVKHARLTSSLAERFGGTPRSPEIGASRDPYASEARLELAIDNAVEGCVREAFGSLVAAFQASHAEDAGVRATFSKIAIDEAEHAMLSFALEAWLWDDLSETERAAVERAKERAWLDLEAACEVQPAADVVRVAGMPTASQAKGLLADLRMVARAAA